MSAALGSPLSTAVATQSVRLQQPIKRQRRKLMLPITLLLVAVAWGIGRQKWYTPGSEVGYYMGVVGSIMLLTLLLYPLRKHVGFMQFWGAHVSWHHWSLAYTAAPHFSCGLAQRRRGIELHASGSRERHLRRRLLPTPFLKELGILADTVHGTA